MIVKVPISIDKKQLDIEEPEDDELFKIGNNSFNASEIRRVILLTEKDAVFNMGQFV